MARQNDPNDPFDPEDPSNPQNPQNPQNPLQPETMGNGVDFGNVTFGGGGFSPSSPYQGQPTKGNQSGFTVGNPYGGGWDYGWDFGAHQGQSFSYANPAEGAKYAFAKYVSDNRLDPNSANAASIAAGLNQLYGSNVFRADGDRRVSYGDEFVDWSGQGKPAGQWFWGTAAPAGSVGGGGGGLPAGTGGVQPPQGGTGSGAGGANLNSLTSSAIQQLLQQGQEPVTAQSVSAQYLPVRTAMERQQQIASEQAAQAAAAQGLPQGGGAAEGTRASMAENLATAEGQIQAGLITQELQARRQMVVQAIAAAQGQERLRLQELLQQYDNAIRQQQLGLQGQQLGLQQQQINNQNTQWWNQFGFNNALQEYLLNQAFQQGLGS